MGDIHTLHPSPRSLSACFPLSIVFYEDCGIFFDKMVCFWSAQSVGTTVIGRINLASIIGMLFILSAIAEEDSERLKRDSRIESSRDPKAETTP
jgi:hypothetical protein